MQSEPTATQRRWDLILPLAVFAVVFAAHYFSPILRTRGDTSWSIHTAVSLIREGNLDIQEYEPFAQQQDMLFACTHRGKLYSNWPHGPSVLSVPLVWVMDITCEAANVDLSKYVSGCYPEEIERFIAAFYVALAASFIFLIARNSLSICVSFPPTLIFAFGTSAWSTGSRALWSHTPSLFFIALTLWLLVTSEKSPRRLWFAGVTVALACVSRSANLPLALFVSLFVLLRQPRQFTPYFIGGSIVALLHLYLIHREFGEFIPPYEHMIIDMGRYYQPRYGEAAAGLLVSPARGLFIYTPVFLFSIWGIVLGIRQGPNRLLALCLTLSLIFTYVMTVLWPIWWAGWSFGPRVFTDAVPLFVFFLIAPIKRLDSMTGWRGWLLNGIFGLALLLSVAIHAVGAFSQAAYEWDSNPVDIGLSQERLWDWSDPPFLAPLTERADHVSH